MSMLGAHLDDAALAVARDGVMLSSAPSIVHADPADRARFGRTAADTARRSPHQVSSTHWSSLARGAEASRAAMPVLRAELRERLAASCGPGDTLRLAVPAALDPASLAWVLGACRAESLPVTALHDAAAVAVAALGLEGVVVVLEAGLYHVAASRVVAEGGTARRLASRVVRDAGWMPLRQAWMQTVAEAMLLRSRFDPLHEAATEQRLFDRIDTAAAEAASGGSTTLELPTTGGPAVSVTLSRDQLAAAARPLQRAALRLIGDLRPSDASFTLLIPAAWNAVPGLCDALTAMPGVRAVWLPAGSIARAVSQISPDAVERSAATDDGSAVEPADEGVTLHRAVTFAAPLEVAAESVAAEAAISPPAPPTHVLWNGAVVALSEAIEIGRMPAPGGIRLEEGLAGVSRLHCSLRASAQGVEVIDHSRHGTWLNGRRIIGRAALAAGDRLRLGDPGIELALIAVGGGADAR
jgi:hypothetical protein